MTNIAILCLIWLLFFVISATGHQEIRIASYNLWNVMFGWDVRKHRIAEMIKESEVDIIGFQEVRSNRQKTMNQLIDLQNLLPEYRWMRFHPAQDVKFVDGSYHKEWIREGVGVLSRWPIIKSRVHVLTTGTTGDTNKRLTLSIQVAVNEKVIVNVVVVHFSYDRQQQCKNAAEILKHIATLQLANAVVIGDFNTYTDFDWPPKVFTSIDRDGGELGPCLEITSSLITGGKMALEFDDVWEAVVATKTNGFTFSNMPKPGLVSRPDRILASTVFKPISLSLIGNGDVYKKLYRDRLLLNRFMTIITEAKAAFYGQTGYPCLQDCGPEGSCRCGVCVAGGNSLSCALPDCPECNSTTFINVILLSLIHVIAIVQLLYGAIVVLRLSLHRHGRNIQQIMGLNCCLCNPNLYSSQPALDFVTPKRNSVFSQFKRFWPCLRLKPIPFLVFGAIFYLLTLFAGKYLFRDLLNTTYNIMAEEFFPSDHLMLVAKLSVDTEDA